MAEVGQAIIDLATSRVAPFPRSASVLTLSTQTTDDGKMQRMLAMALSRAGRPLLAEVKLATCRVFKMTMRELVSPIRCRALARPRQMAMYLCYHLTARSYPEIGRAFGDRDHTTVIHACRRIEDLLADDPEVALGVLAIHLETQRLVEARNAMLVQLQ